MIHVIFKFGYEHHPTEHQKLMLHLEDTDRQSQSQHEYQVQLVSWPPFITLVLSSPATLFSLRMLSSQSCLRISCTFVSFSISFSKRTRRPSYAAHSYLNRLFSSFRASSYDWVEQPVLFLESIMAGWGRSLSACALPDLPNLEAFMRMLTLSTERTLFNPCLPGLSSPPIFLATDVCGQCRWTPCSGSSGEGIVGEGKHWADTGTLGIWMLFLRGEGKWMSP